ncbi:class I SAM-dependent DNA methyltransferase [Paenibacillus sp. FSL W7-1287]|uniref:class I SAM-dependent DNA methyltransferase n=1 Tax=Paenibacillus sp. FSL W7-1287 TaxID=2954538 RepID=UPI0030F4DC88
MSSYEQFASVYDRLMADMPYDRWLSFAKAVWERYGVPQHVVDLGCGTGAIAIPLASEGFDVTGIDLSAHMLEVALSKWNAQCESARGSLKLEQQNISSWSVDNSADSIISFCDCLNYIVDEDELLAALQATYEGLKPGGTFIFDVHPVSRFEQYAAEQPFVYDEDGIAYQWISDYDEDEHIIEHHLTIFVLGQDGRYSRIDEQHIQRAYPHMWLVGALREIGFREVHIYQNFALEQAEADAERLFFVALK